MEELLIKIFCDMDDLNEIIKKECKTITGDFNENSTLKDKDKDSVKFKSRMHISEIATILIYFHHSGYRCFKWYYKNKVETDLKCFFPKLVSYNRFIEIAPSAFYLISLYLLIQGFGKCSGLSFLDSTFLDVCHCKRIYSHKVFESCAKRGKGSTGWHYGFKLHLIINDRGEIISFHVTPGNVDDRNMDVIEKLTENVFGKVFADRGYISQKLSEYLLSKSITLVTKIKKNMKNKLMVMEDKILLRKRCVIESVNDFLKNICCIEHTRHRSMQNFVMNIISAIAAYGYIDKKPSLNFIDDYNKLISA